MAATDDRIRDLYILPPSEFIGARNRLATELRDAGDREGAERVARIRKPTVAAWGMNRASRDEPRLVRALVDASDRLRDVQSRGARSAALKEASSARRRAVEHLADAAKAELGDAGESHEDEITQTLLAAATDAETRQRLETGTLERATTATANFEDLGSLLAASVGAATRSRTKSAPKERPPAMDRRALQRARDRSGKLDAEAGEAEVEADRLLDAARTADRQAKRRARETDKARQAADEARKRADRARQRAERAREKADEAAGALAELEGTSA